MKMEKQEASSIAKDVVKETKTPSSGGRVRGRPAGSKKGTSSNPLLNMKTQKQLKAIGKSMGFRPSLFKNRSDSISKITTAASRGKTPLGMVVEAAEGKISMPTSVLQATQEMEQERKEQRLMGKADTSRFARDETERKKPSRRKARKSGVQSGRQLASRLAGAIDIVRSESKY